MCLTPVTFGQSVSGLVSKTQAIGALQVSSIAGWKEIVSDEGRFRIVFPGEPQLDDDVISVKGLKLVVDDSTWLASYSDFDYPGAEDPEQLRRTYHVGMAAIARSSSDLSRQRDVLLNGTLGSEMVIAPPGRVSYMRAFLVGRRLYMLAVYRKRVGHDNGAIPSDVKQFFESFTFWDVQ